MMRGASTTSQRTLVARTRILPARSRFAGTTHLETLEVTCHLVGGTGCRIWEWGVFAFTMIDDYWYDYDRIGFVEVEVVILVVKAVVADGER